MTLIFLSCWIIFQSTKAQISPNAPRLNLIANISKEKTRYAKDVHLITITITNTL